MTLIQKYLLLLIIVSNSCNRKIVTEDINMEISTETQLLTMVIPHQDNLEWITNIINDIRNNEDKIFRDGDYIYRDNKDLSLDSEELKENLINDHLQDYQYWVPIKDLDTNHKIWHWLSVFVGNYNIPDMRNHLTSEIYDNPNFDRNIGELSNLFQKTDHLIYEINYKSDRSIGILKKSDFPKFVQLASHLNMKVRELKKDH